MDRYSIGESMAHDRLVPSEYSTKKGEFTRMFTKYAVISGTPTSRWDITGPFEGDHAADDAEDWGKAEFGPEPFWWVVPMNLPLYTTCNACGNQGWCECEVATTGLPLMGKEMEHLPQHPPTLRLLPPIDMQLEVPGTANS
jgi:hypothetical protein